MTARPGRASRVHKHQFTPEPDFPADHRGRRRCQACGLMGAPGDPHHPIPDTAATTRPRPLPPALAAAAAARDAAILGEKDEDE